LKPLKWIAEIGINHLADPQLALRYVEDLARAGVDAVTFQERELAFYDHSKPYAFRLSDETYRTLAERCRSRGLGLGIIVGDPQRIDFFSSLEPDFYKILSRDFSHTELWIRLLAQGVPVYASTGGINGVQIQQALQSFPDVRLIHTEFYPGSEHANISAIATISAKFKVPVAYGLHGSQPELLILCLPYLPEKIFFYTRHAAADQMPDGMHAIPLEEVPHWMDRLKLLTLAIGDGEKNGGQGAQ